MRGRKTFSPEIDKAADFISDEFKKAGLQTFNGANGYRQDFAMVNPKFVSGSATFDNDQVDFKNVYATVLNKWLNADDEKILGKKFDQLKFL